MQKPIYRREYVTLLLDTAVPLIVEKWHAPVSGTEFEQTMMTKLALFQQYRAEYPGLGWLNQLNDLQLNDTRSVQWQMREFMQKLADAGVQRVAFLVSEEAFYNLPPRDRGTRKDDGQQPMLCYFGDWESAVYWLMEGSMLS